MPDEEAVTPPKIFAWISIVSQERSPEQISTLTGVQPDRSWRIGDKRANTSIIEKTHGWILTSRVKDIGLDVEAHLDDLLQRIKPATERFASLPEPDVVTVHVAIYSQSRILMSLEPHVPKLIAALGARFDIEIYFMPPDGR
ncbi:MAG TPA: DUF4279 domain-containing protein [Vicinamibacterales bacterium]|nr:DUF4279 domain-containing protein [Vicinamibacterales bacterium]